MSRLFYLMLRMRFGLCCLLPLLTSSAIGQVDHGRISGTVKDQTDAVLPGATVTVKNERTGEERTVTSNNMGDYFVAPLKPSVYSVRISARNFAPAETRTVQVPVGKDVRVDLVLKPAEVVESVVVSLEGGERDVSNGVNVTASEVGGLPMNGRQVSQLYLRLIRRQR